jgi:hypothetical protein
MLIMELQKLISCMDFEQLLTSFCSAHNQNLFGTHGLDFLEPTIEWLEYPTTFSLAVDLEQNGPL